jgi:DNA repair protein RecN (Recombination protein N)
MALSSKRKEAIARFESLVKEELKELNFKASIFTIKKTWITVEGTNYSYVDIGSKKVRATINGIDEIEFLISLNPGESARPLAKIASGGEISRIMLALKSIVSGMDNIVSMVFDEIDAGIGGSTAITVGKKLNLISLKCQVICITHLPQIAAFADTHFSIDKIVEKGRTKIKIYQLEDDSKIHELSRMLSGMSESDISLKHAVELIGEINKIKQTVKIESG